MGGARAPFAVRVVRVCVARLWAQASTPCVVRAQVDVLPIGPGGAMVAAVNYFRDIASFLEAPVSPVGPQAK